MKFSENPLSPEEIKIAEQEDEAARLDGRLSFLEFKYKYAIHAYPPTLRYDFQEETIEIDGACGGYEDYTPAPPVKDYVMPQGGLYAIMKECIARKIPWEELLDAEPYLTKLREEQEEGMPKCLGLIPSFDIYERFPDYFNCKELQAGFTWKELRKNEISVEEMTRLIRVYNTFDDEYLSKSHPDIYHECKEIQKLGRQQWEEQYKRRMEAKRKARWEIYHAAEKFFLENDELPPKPAKEPAQHG
ncbi:MAG: hypothetical protein K6G50_00705 [bacterium]|nr:hypothetical protein [bacterium]